MPSTVIHRDFRPAAADAPGTPLDGSLAQGDQWSLQWVTEEKGRLAGELAAVRDRLEAEQARRERAEAELQVARKLATIGRIAAGIAHEINSPMQFVSDNLAFIESGIGQVLTFLDPASRLSKTGDAQGAAPVEALAADTDLEYLVAEIPCAVAQAIEGIQRVIGIVSAVKEFSHPGTGEFGLVDVNAALRTTALLTRNEWKLVAEVTFDLDPDLPRVPGLAHELNQVWVNLVVNAAHALKDQASPRRHGLGNIVLATRTLADAVEVRIADDGPGVPPGLRERIFDAFFTTKEPGLGTGQGLAIARAIVAGRHGGRLWCTSEPGAGATFLVELPCPR